MIVDLVKEMGFSDKRIAIELNKEILPFDQYAKTALNTGDRVEIVQAIGGGQGDAFRVAGKTYHSRLLVGTGKYKDMQETRLAIEASGAEIVTVAIRRTNIGQNADEPNLLDVISPDKFTILPNTAGCFTVDDALRTCRLGRELLGGHKLVKLEVLADQKTLFPDVSATIEAAGLLVKDGFDVMVYTNDDPIAAKRLEDIGCVAVMPLAAPIGSGLGIRNPYNILTIVENANIPILVDAGATDLHFRYDLSDGPVYVKFHAQGGKYALDILRPAALHSQVVFGDGQYADPNAGQKGDSPEPPMITDYPQSRCTSFTYNDFNTLKLETYRVTGRPEASRLTARKHPAAQRGLSSPVTSSSFLSALVHNYGDVPRTSRRPSGKA